MEKYQYMAMHGKANYAWELKRGQVQTGGQDGKAIQVGH